MKKILIGIIILFSLFIGNTNIVNAEAECSSESFLNDGKLCSPDYMINTTNLGLTKYDSSINTGSTAKKTVETGLTVIVNKLLIAFGVLALFIMTIGGGYMIFAAGQDELLNKGKSIFNSGLIALLVALGSGIIMKIVIYLLY